MWLIAHWGNASAGQALAFRSRGLKANVRVEFILCEDGSVDCSKEVLRRVAEEIPARLLLSDERKGYSGAVRDGMLAIDAPYVLCLDSDGQCDPKDFRPPSCQHERATGVMNPAAIER